MQHRCLCKLRMILRSRVLRVLYHLIKKLLRQMAKFVAGSLNPVFSCSLLKHDSSFYAPLGNTAVAFTASTCLHPQPSRACAETRRSPPSVVVFNTPPGTRNVVIAAPMTSFWIFKSFSVLECPAGERLSRAPPDLPRPRDRAMRAPHDSPRCAPRKNGRRSPTRRAGGVERNPPGDGMPGPRESGGS